MLLVCSKGIILLWLFLNYYENGFVADIPEWVLPALPAFFLFLLSVLVQETARYCESMLSPDVFSSMPDAEGLRMVALWVAWSFPFELFVNAIIGGAGPGMTPDTWRGLFGKTDHGEWYWHTAFSVMSLCAWAAAIGMSFASKAPT